jgi:hypothetical protein
VTGIKYSLVEGEVNYSPEGGLAITYDKAATDGQRVDEIFTEILNE